MKTPKTTLNFSKNAVVELNQNQLYTIKGGSIIGSVAPLTTTFDPSIRITTDTREDF